MNSSDIITSRKIYTYVTTPTNLQSKWLYFFGNASKSQLEKLKMDGVAMYSVTDYKTADKITNILLSLKGINSSSSILDAMACVGGNTISFARKGLHVISNEMDTTRFKILKHNTRVYQLSKQVIFYNEDLFTLYKKIKTDIVFMDPPWGGTDYKKNKNTHLLINGIDVSAVCYRLRIMTKYIILKAPLNFHLIDFKHKIHVYQQKDTTYKITIKRPILFKKMMIIVLHIQPNRVLNN